MSCHSDTVQPLLIVTQSQHLGINAAQGLRVTTQSPRLNYIYILLNMPFPGLEQSVDHVISDFPADSMKHNWRQLEIIILNYDWLNVLFRIPINKTENFSATF